MVGPCVCAAVLCSHVMARPPDWSLNVITLSNHIRGQDKSKNGIGVHLSLLKYVWPQARNCTSTYNLFLLLVVLDWNLSMMAGEVMLHSHRVIRLVIIRVLLVEFPHWLNTFPFRRCICHLVSQCTWIHTECCQRYSLMVLYVWTQALPLCSTVLYDHWEGYM